ncbi:NAD(P)H-dependent oxidoreductase [Orrella sp. JC864]|uniref:FMN-dependent NADH-azoreductase n=1 Tax=Orrella sp. JC864 TaxID=3120298 RepID=UPI003009011A
MKTLVLLSSILGEASLSSGLARHAIAKIQAREPQGAVIVRDLAAEPLPYFDAAAAGALFTPAQARTPAQQQIVELSDGLVRELFEADRLVIAVPIYNFGIPAQLKSYLDFIARAGVTFRYNADGTPQGLVTGKQVIVLVSRGGQALGTPVDTATPYLRTMLGFLGMDDVTVIAAEGVKMGQESLDRALGQARGRIETLLAA